MKSTIKTLAIEWWQAATPAQTERLLADGAEVNAWDESGWTPLHEAAGFNENPEVLQGLVRAGAEVKARDKDGGTALHEAAADNQNPEVIEVLLQAGANPKVRDNDGKLPADYAAENEHIKNSKARWLLHEARY